MAGALEALHPLGIRFRRNYREVMADHRLRPRYSNTSTSLNFRRSLIL